MTTRLSPGVGQEADWLGWRKIALSRFLSGGGIHGLDAIPRLSSVAPGTILLASGFWGDPGCNNETLQDVPSPDGHRHAVVFERNCGATTDFSTQVFLLTQGRTVKGAGNLFTADSDHGKAAAGRGGGPSVTVRWLDKRTLEIRYNSHARIFSEDTRHDDTDIMYVVDLVAPATR